MAELLPEADKNNGKASDRMGCVPLPFKYKSKVMTLQLIS
jgi:hypothetical protein